MKVDLEWRKIDKFGDLPKDLGPEFLIKDEHDHISVGFTAFDFYDAEYWFPMPKDPFGHVTITNDQWIANLFKGKK